MLLHSTRSFYCVTLCVILVLLLFFLRKAGSEPITCVTTVVGSGGCVPTYKSWCTCEATNECYVSTTKFFDQSGTLQSLEEYGCLSYPLLCPDGPRMIDIHNYNTYQVFNCCDDGDYCNENITALLDDPVHPSLLLTPTAMASSMSTPAPSGASNSELVPWVFIAGILAFVLALLTVLCIIVGLAVYCSRCCSISHLTKCGMKACHLCRYHSSRDGPGGESNETDFNSIPMEIDPVPITDTDITITSGSGKGMPHLVQRTIARSFVLGNVIGGGRFGQVYIGYYQGEQYAVKKFFSRDEQSWYHESEIYSTINMRHENILSCFATDILSNNGVTELWLITQYQPRGSLYDVLSAETIDFQTGLKFAVSVCRGLTYLHDELAGTQGKPAIAHRDIKSKNILVRENYACCIADFGMALVKNSSSPNLTTPQNIREGTKRYMAPEVLAETIDLTTFESFLRTDMYAYGLVLWEVCRRCDFADGPEEYELPFMSMVPPDPSFEDMREMVVERGCSPQIPNRWASSDLLKSLTMLMKECWYSDPAARPTAFYIKKKLERITQNSHLKFSSEKS